MSRAYGKIGKTSRKKDVQYTRELDSSETSVCRTCRKEGNTDSFVGFTVETLGGTTIADMIYEISGVAVLENQLLPQIICPVCFDRLRAAHRFREQCIRTNAILSKQFAMSTQKGNSDEPLNDEKIISMPHRERNNVEESLGQLSGQTETAEPQKIPVNNQQQSGLETQPDQLLVDSSQLEDFHENEAVPTVEEPGVVETTDQLSNYDASQFEIVEEKEHYNLLKFVICRFCACTNPFKAYKELSRHEEHSGKPTGKTLFKCSGCFRGFTSKSAKFSQDINFCRFWHHCKLCDLLLLNRTQTFKHLQQQHDISEDDLDRLLQAKSNDSVMKSEAESSDEWPLDDCSDNEVHTVKQEKLKPRRQIIPEHFRELSRHGTFNIVELTKHICCGCDKVYDDANSLNKHVLVDHPRNAETDEAESAEFECEMCKMQTNSRLKMVAHRKRQAQRQFYLCALCEGLFDGVARFRSHMKQDESHAIHYGIHQPDIKDKYSSTVTYGRKCCKCSAYFESLEAALEHAKEEHLGGVRSTSDNTCHICDKRFRTADSLRRHSTAITPRFKYHCKMCDMQSKSLCYMQRHLYSTVHDGDETYQIDIPPILEGFTVVTPVRQCCFPKCKKSFESFELILEHISLEHSEEKSKNQQEKPTEFQCNFCSQFFRNKTAMRTHRRKIASQKRHVCAYCGKTFENNVKLSAHERTHTGERPFKCDLCTRGFTSKRILLAHRETHAKHTIKCTICSKKFNLRRTLKRHMDYCHSQVTFACPRCPRQLRCKAELWRHLRNHTGARPFKCREGCERHFTANNDRRIHEMAAHTMERPHKCEFCEAAFVRKHQRVIHERLRHTGERPFRCDTCNAGFAAAYLLRKHKKMDCE